MGFKKRNIFYCYLKDVRLIALHFIIFNHLENCKCLLVGHFALLPVSTRHTSDEKFNVSK